jgi:peroxiredoxin
MKEGEMGRLIRGTHEVGHPAAQFALPDVEGGVHRLEDYQGHWLLLVFHRHLG